MDEEELDDEVNDEDDMQQPLEGEDLIGGVADCAVMRELVEAATPMTGRKDTSCLSRVPRMSVSHGTTSDKEDSDVNVPPPN